MNKITLNRVLAAFVAIFLVLVILDLAVNIPFEESMYVRMAVGLLAGVILSLNEPKAVILFCCISGVIGGFIDNAYSGAVAGALLAYGITQVVRKALTRSAIS